jgi:hypothetical protein
MALAAANGHRVDAGLFGRNHVTAICIGLLPVQTGHYDRRSLVVAV